MAITTGQTINELQAGVAPTGTEELPAWQTGATRKLTVTQLRSGLATSAQLAAVEAAAPKLAGNNAFAGQQIITSPSGQTGLAITQSGDIAALSLSSFDNGAGAGGMLNVGRNTNATTPAPGALILAKVNPNANQYLWVDDSGRLRTLHNTLINASNRNGGALVGEQTSNERFKVIEGEPAPIWEVLARVAGAAGHVHRFRYTEGHGGPESYEGLVLKNDAPETWHYGNDRLEEGFENAGKSLNTINLLGDLLRTVAWLADRVAALEAGAG